MPLPGIGSEALPQRSQNASLQRLGDLTMAAEAKRTVRQSILLLFLCVLIPILASSQRITRDEIAEAQQMLKAISADVKKHYYDPKFHGVDWDAKTLEAKRRIDAAPNLNGALAEISKALDSLSDSHTIFIPPSRRFRLDYGWVYQVIGDRCYFVGVRPDSDAAAKGVEPGNQLLAMNGLVPNRGNIEKLDYVFRVFRPIDRVTLDLRDPKGHLRRVEVNAKVMTPPRKADSVGGDVWGWEMDMEEWQRQNRARAVEIGDVVVLKLPSFLFLEGEPDEIINKARKHKALIVDLRSNPGGSEDSLRYFVGKMFEHEVKIADRVGREVKESLIAKPHGASFSGKLIVLVDSNSASAAELFARVIQLEKRGVVLGDRTSGMVMEGKEYTYHVGVESVYDFGAQITHADLIMTDGKSLEHGGVTPDEIVLPTAEDIAGRRDPVLAYALEMTGGKLSAEAAGKLFPFVWPRW
jgi:C-terminal processing protease CtpA/Prc